MAALASGGQSDDFGVSTSCHAKPRLKVAHATFYMQMGGVLVWYMDEKCVSQDLTKIDERGPGLS